MKSKAVWRKTEAREWAAGTVQVVDGALSDSLPTSRVLTGPSAAAAARAGQRSCSCSCSCPWATPAAYSSLFVSFDGASRRCLEPREGNHLTAFSSLSL